MYLISEFIIKGIQVPGASVSWIIHIALNQKVLPKPLILKKSHKGLRTG